MTAPLVVYLRDHEAAARAGVDLFRRAARSQRTRPWGSDLADLRDDVSVDLGALRAVMAALGVRTAPGLGAVFRIAERAARLKPNGRALGRSALSDLIEIEAAQDAVHAKATGWTALIKAGIRPDTVDLEEMSARAERQRDRLLGLHAIVAAQTLAARPHRGPTP